MQIAWLEELVKEGHVRPSARDLIYRDCGLLVKVASAKDDAVQAAFSKVDKFFDQNQVLIGSLLSSGVGFLGGSMFNKMRAKRTMAEFQQAVTTTKRVLLSHADFRDNREKASARFDELVRIAPTIASNPDLTLRIIKEKLYSGFSGQDVQNLALIQASYTSDMGQQRGMTAAAASATKTASAKRVGETLATVFSMCKEAGLSPSTLGRAAENALVLSTIPVLGGLGIGAVKLVMDSRDRKQTQRRLSSAFEQAMQLGDPEHDSLHENKAKAQQAFQILAHFSPHVALEPNAARSFMKKLVEWSDRGPQVEDIKNLSEIERNYRQTAKGSPFFEGLASGSKALGLDKALSSSVTPLSRPLNAELMGMAADDLNLSLSDLEKNR